MRKLSAIMLAVALVFAVAACGGTPSSSAPAPSQENPESSATPGAGFKTAMVTDVGGVNDQSFNQSAWEGLQSLKDKGVEVSYLESKQEADYGPNLDRLVDEEQTLIWGVGYALAGAIEKAAKENPDGLYAIVDNAYAETPANLTGIVFRAEEPSFLVGYIAGMMTKTDKVGFIGGMEGDVIGTFQRGYEGGVALAAKELGKNIEVFVQYAESFGDQAKGKAIATKMYGDGADIIFHAAGGVGVGLFDAAKEAGKFAIGVDSDQNYLAPDNIITSAMKRVGDAMAEVTLRIKDGENLGGQTLNFGCKEGFTGIAPTSDKHVPAEVLAKVAEVEKKIVSGEIKVPTNEATLNEFKDSLK